MIDRVTLADILLPAVLKTMDAIDWVVDRLEREDDIPEFLRDEHKPFQWTGRPRKNI